MTRTSPCSIPTLERYNFRSRIPGDSKKTIILFPPGIELGSSPVSLDMESHVAVPQELQQLLADVSLEDVVEVRRTACPESPRDRLLNPGVGRCVRRRCSLFRPGSACQSRSVQSFGRCFQRAKTRLLTSLFLICSNAPRFASARRWLTSGRQCRLVIGAWQRMRPMRQQRGNIDDSTLKKCVSTTTLQSGGSTT